MYKYIVGRSDQMYWCGKGRAAGKWSKDIADAELYNTCAGAKLRLSAENRKNTLGPLLFYVVFELDLAINQVTRIRSSV